MPFKHFNRTIRKFSVLWGLLKFCWVYMLSWLRCVAILISSMHDSFDNQIHEFSWHMLYTDNQILITEKVRILSWNLCEIRYTIWWHSFFRDFFRRGLFHLTIGVNTIQFHLRNDLPTFQMCIISVWPLYRLNKDWLSMWISVWLSSDIIFDCPQKSGYLWTLNIFQCPDCLFSHDWLREIFGNLVCHIPVRFVD